MKTVWTAVSEKGSEFLVARDGRVKVPARIAGGQAKAEKLLAPYLNHRGYPVVTQQRGDKRPKHFVHRLVGLAFVSGHFEGATINHRNGIKTDNRAENLEWITKAENTAHQWRTGLINLRGEQHPGAKLDDAEVAVIRKARQIGARVGDLALSYGVSQSIIYKILSGTRRAA